MHMNFYYVVPTISLDICNLLSHQVILWKHISSKVMLPMDVNIWQIMEVVSQDPHPRHLALKMNFLSFINILQPIYENFGISKDLESWNI